MSGTLEEVSHALGSQGIHMLCQIKDGSCHSRAILFKVLADTVGLECKLIVVSFLFLLQNVSLLSVIVKKIKNLFHLLCLSKSYSVEFSSFHLMHNHSGVSFLLLPNSYFFFQFPPFYLLTNIRVSQEEEHWSVQIHLSTSMSQSFWIL